MYNSGYSYYGRKPAYGQSGPSTYMGGYYPPTGRSTKYSDPVIPFIGGDAYRAFQGAYPPRGGAYPHQGGAYPPPPHGSPYPPPPRGDYPPPRGAYPPQGGAYPPGYPQGPHDPMAAASINDYFVTNIIIFLFFAYNLISFIVGIFAIMKSWECQRAKQAGDVPRAMQTSASARKLMIATIVTGIVLDAIIVISVVSVVYSTSL